MTVNNREHFIRLLFGPYSRNGTHRLIYYLSFLILWSWSLHRLFPFFCKFYFHLSLFFFFFLSPRRYTLLLSSSSSFQILHIYLLGIKFSIQTLRFIRWDFVFVLKNSHRLIIIEINSYIYCFLKIIRLRKYCSFYLFFSMCNAVTFNCNNGAINEWVWDIFLLKAN